MNNKRFLLLEDLNVPNSVGTDGSNNDKKVIDDCSASKSTTQVTTVIAGYVFATCESMKSAMNGMDRPRPRSIEY